VGERRTFVNFVAVLALGSHLPVAPQQKRAAPLVVWLGINPPDPGEIELTIDLFRAGLRDLGYVDGRNVVVEYRHTHRQPERLAELIDEQIQQRVDVIMSARADMVLAAMRATRSIPIVFAAIDDPVGAGIVDSLAKPGANVTGVAWDSTTAIAGKQLQLLREVQPGGRELAILWNPDVKGARDFFREAQSAAGSSAVVLRSFEVRTPDDLEAAFSGMTSARVTAVQILGSWFTWQYRERLTGLAARHRLPAIYGNRDSVAAGGLMSYGPSLPDEFRRAAGLVVKILNGARPGDLPVEQPTKFELVINLKAAKALGLAIPNALLLRADEVVR